MDSLQHPKFIENVLRSYLGRYQSQFHNYDHLSGQVVLITEPPPILAITLASTEHGVFVVLQEWVPVDQMSELAGVCEYQAYDIANIRVEDPNGLSEMETKVAKSLLSPI